MLPCVDGGLLQRVSACMPAVAYEATSVELDLDVVVGMMGAPLAAKLGNVGLRIFV